MLRSRFFATASSSGLDDVGEESAAKYLSTAVSRHGSVGSPTGHVKTSLVEHTACCCDDAWACAYRLSVSRSPRP